MTNKMTTPDYTQKMSELRARVGQHAKLNNVSNKSALSTIKSVIPTINTKSIFFYATPLVILVVIFFIMRPGFVCNDHIDKDNVITSKIDVKKVIIAGLISGTVISVGLFAYFRQKN